MLSQCGQESGTTQQGCFFICPCGAMDTRRRGYDEERKCGYDVRECVGFDFLKEIEKKFVIPWLDHGTQVIKSDWYNNAYTWAPWSSHGVTGKLIGSIF